MNRNMRLALMGALVAAAVVAFVIAKPGGNDNRSPTASRPATSRPSVPPSPRILVRGARPVSGIRKIQVKRGEPVRFTVSSDVADEIHVHGYDLKRDVPAGGSVTFKFPARIDGVFEIELEGRKQQIAELRVAP